AMDPLLKQRMVGTAVIIGLAVIFVPMVLDGPVDHPDTPHSVGVPLPLPDVSTTTPVPAEPVESAAVTPATMTETTSPPPVADGDWAVQLGSFSDATNAEALATRVKSEGFDAFVQRV